MIDFNSTTRFTSQPIYTNGQIMTVFDGKNAPFVFSLSTPAKTIITFGRDDSNDIILSSPLVSRKHGRFVFENNKWFIEDLGSTNGLIFNNTNITKREVIDGDFIRIDDGLETIPDGVLFVFSSTDSPNKWESFPIAGLNCITIGRDPSSTLHLPHVSVSKQHAAIVAEYDKYYIYDNNSTNGVIVNGKRIYNKTQLHEKDVILIANTKLIFTSGMLFFCRHKSGISVDACDILIRRGSGTKSFVTCNHVNLSIKPGELVAIIGGSGAGKSTILNCMCGYLPPTQGDVYINGVNLYENFDSLKKIMGYVPQSDIIYDNLTLYDMLMYTAKLRLPEDISPAEREAAINKAIATVELTEKKNSMIKRLSGGQKKRASIAVELLSDPNILFLDEPASGLDPGTERNLMLSLRQMADNGKTVILVTHSTLQLKLCDKIVFMGKGGNLCFCGSHDEALTFFGVSDIIDIYNLITDDPLAWSSRYSRTTVRRSPPRENQRTPYMGTENKWHQLKVLCARYLKLVTNDRQRLLLLLLQAPILALLISFVADGNQFEQYEMTKSLLFALSCSAFWIGMLNSIQEICKEKTILKREFMTGLSLESYISSKIIVLGLLCTIQSTLVVGVFALLVGLPSEGVFLAPLIELFLTTLITAVASTAMGLFVSSLFTNADRAMTVAPLLLMPQILFSGLIFKLEGPTEIISWLAVCRWSMESFGSTANLNTLTLRLAQEGVMVPHEYESFYKFTAGHILGDWFILIVFTGLFLVAADLILRKTGKEKS